MPTQRSMIKRCVVLSERDGSKGDSARVDVKAKELSCVAKVRKLKVDDVVMPSSPRHFSNL